MNEPILSVKDLSIKLEGKNVISDISFEVEKGEILIIIGPNGAGKTMMLRSLIGVIPHEGEISWHKKIKIGYVPQRLPLIKDVPLSVKDFFSLKKIPEREMKSLIESVGVRSEILSSTMANLSSGQFQRILVAYALAGSPDILLFDEPLAGVDVSGQETIYDLLEKIHKEKKLTIILVSHDLNVVYSLATKVLCLNKKGICYGEPRKMLTVQNLSKLYGGGVQFYFHKHD